jgi:hypothetical protein
MRPPSRISIACLKPSPGSPEQVVVGDEAVLHHHLGGVGGADAELVLLLAGAEALHALLDHEGRDVAAAFRPSGSVTAKTTQTSPTEPWVVKVLAPSSTQPPSTFSARAGAGGVRARVGLGQAPGADLLPEASGTSQRGAARRRRT